ncbi:MAG: put [Labilithrix sp.]|nr:put [Labilithrix sp.]
MNRRAFAIVLGLSALLCACPKDAPKGGDGGARLRIAVVPKGTTHEFWKSVHAGALKAAKELDVDIVWKGPIKEDDLKAQVDVVSTFVAQGVSGLVLAPLNESALRAPVKQAREAKIPTVVFDSDLAGDEHVSFVATDNVAAGKLAADHVDKLLGGKGNVVVMRYQEGSASTQNREKGFLDGIRARPGLTVTSDNQYGGATTESAFAKAESLLLSQKAETGAVNGIFTPNESTTFGMLLALRKSGVARKARFVGFDASEKLTSALREGDIDGLVVQKPFDMGYVAVKTLVQHLRGGKVERRIDTGARLVTKENLDDPEVKQLLAPDLKTWLGE